MTSILKKLFERIEGGVDPLKERRVERTAAKLRELSFNVRVVAASDALNGRDDEIFTSKNNVVRSEASFRAPSLTDAASE
jgi:hypothetical protein